MHAASYLQIGLEWRQIRRFIFHSRPSDRTASREDRFHFIAPCIESCAQLLQNTGFPFDPPL